MSPSDGPDADLTAELEELWASMLPVLHRRVAQLWGAADAAAAGTLDAAALAAASTAAHTLIGSLGTYGRHAGSEAARDAEQALRTQPVDTAALQRAVARLADIVQLT
ncbi:MAG TPA: hypothetical protein VFP61_09445 [Acidimicrobiales bacterium]|nr:hypothetical protein [Acidimicrobiales bacterium]